MKFNRYYQTNQMIVLYIINQGMLQGEWRGGVTFLSIVRFYLEDFLHFWQEFVWRRGEKFSKESRKGGGREINKICVGPSLLNNLIPRLSENERS